MKTSVEIIKTLKAFALAHYNEGYDVFIECYDYAEWKEFLADCHESEEEALALMAQLADVYSERQADAENSRDQADYAYDVALAQDKEEFEAAEECEAAHEWECEMAAIRAAEGHGYVDDFYAYTDTDYRF